MGEIPCFMEGTTLKEQELGLARERTPVLGPEMNTIV
jgi:hypothetical protein